MKSSTKNRGLICIGRSGVDLYPMQYGRLEDVLSFTKHVGGSPANTAVQAAKLGADTAFLGKVSQDGFGSYVREYLHSVGIDVTHLTKVDDPQIRHSLAVAHQPEHGKISYFFYRTMPADQFLDIDDVDLNFLKQFKLCLISGASLSVGPSREAVLYAMELASQNRVKIAFDPDYREMGWEGHKQAQLYNWMAAQRAQLICATKEEFELATACSGAQDERNAVYKLLDRGAEMICIKNGLHGAEFYLQDGSTFRSMPMPARVQKSLGAGDSFMGTLLAMHLRGMPLQTSAQYAAASASITISGRSCSDSMPDWETLNSYMSAYQESELDAWFDAYLR